MSDEEANYIEGVLGIRHGNMEFWREYHTSPYLRATVQFLLRVRPTT